MPIFKLKANNFNAIYNALIYLLFVVIIAIAFQKYDLVSVISQTGMKDLCILTLYGIIIIGIFSIQQLVTLSIFNVRMELYTAWALSSMNSLFNYVLPAKSGTVFKGIILKKNYGLIYSNYISLLLITNLMVLSSGFFLFIGFAISYEHISIYGLSIIIFFTLIILSCLYGFSEKINKIKFPKHVEYLNKISKGIKICLQNHAKIFFILILNYLVICISALRLYWCFRYLGYNINFNQVLYIQLITSLSFLFSITPANLFIKEGIIIALGDAFGIDGGLVIASAILDRAVSIAAICVSSIISIPRYKKELKFVNRNLN